MKAAASILKGVSNFSMEAAAPILEGVLMF